MITLYRDPKGDKVFKNTQPSDITGKSPDSTSPQNVTMVPGVSDGDNYMQLELKVKELEEKIKEKDKKIFALQSCISS